MTAARAEGAPAPSAVRPRVAAVVLNWNRAELTCRAVASLLALSDVDVTAFVVDNGSANDDVATIRRCVPAARTIALPENAGFARAVNAGAIAAFGDGADYLLLFNNDAHVEAGSSVIAELVDALERDPSLGAAGVTIANDDDRGSIQSSSYRFSLWFPLPRPQKRLGRGRSIVAKDGYLSGSCQLVRARAFAEIGGFDPDFFFYGDDVDFARRLAAAGYRSTILARSGVRHARGASIRVGSSAYVYTALRSNLILIRKHARWYHRPSAFVTSLAATAALAVLGLRHGNAGAFASALRAWRDYRTGRWGGFAGEPLAPAVRPSLAHLRG